MKVLYHAGCTDGFCAAYIWSKKFPDAQYIPVKYGEPPPPGLRNQDVVILDFSYPKELLESIGANSIKVFDHHKTVDVESLKQVCHLTFDLNKSGAKLVQEYLFPGIGNLLVDYVQDYDLWKFELVESKKVNAYINLQPYTFVRYERLEWEFYNSNDVITKGGVVLQVIDSVVQKLVKQAFEVHFEGHKIPFVNTSVYINETLEQLCEGYSFAMAGYMMKNGKRKYSLRSKGDFDVSEIARKYGGGGHKNAAGFTH